LDGLPDLEDDRVSGGVNVWGSRIGIGGTSIVGLESAGALPFWSLRHVEDVEGPDRPLRSGGNVPDCTGIQLTGTSARGRPERHSIS
jgi:hypothetical protein